MNLVSKTANFLSNQPSVSHKAILRNLRTITNLFRTEYQQFPKTQFLKLRKVGTPAKNTPVNAPNALATRSLQNPILILPQQKKLQPNGQHLPFTKGHLSLP